MVLIEDLCTERTVAHAPIKLCLDLGHPFASGAAGPDADPYAWLKHFGPRVPEVQLQQTDGLGDRHWPFTEEHNAGGRVDPGLVLDILADAGAQDVLLILEVIPAFEADDRQVVDGLRASVQVWARALSDRGLR
jgi:sugar phosphate isomerase/epimerase